jgi:hypothetical protein
MEKFASKLLILVLMCGLITCCIRESGTIIDWYIENQSGKDIVVVNTARPDKDPIFIPNGAIHTESWGGQGGSAKEGPFYNAFNIDVIFNNERIINYDYRENMDVFNNPLNWDNYEKVLVVNEKRHKEYKYYYTFLPEQYDMAEPYNPEEPEVEE